MTVSNFSFLQAEWPVVHESAAKAESLTNADPGAACLYARRALAETRDHFIDLLLKEAGWALDQPRDRECEVAGMPNHESKGFVDYVLWGDDGKPLGLVEASKSRVHFQTG
jgi:type I restriction enzyme R subunit